MLYYFLFLGKKICFFFFFLPFSGITACAFTLVFIFKREREVKEGEKKRWGVEILYVCLFLCLHRYKVDIEEDEAHWVFEMRVDPSNQGAAVGDKGGKREIVGSSRCVMWICDWTHPLTLLACHLFYVCTLHRCYVYFDTVIVLSQIFYSPSWRLDFSITLLFIFFFLCSISSGDKLSVEFEILKYDRVYI